VEGTPCLIAMIFVGRCKLKETPKLISNKTMIGFRSVFVCLSANHWPVQLVGFLSRQKKLTFNRTEEPQRSHTRTGGEFPAHEATLSDTLIRPLNNAYGV
jgi:hypothetical protein